MLRTLKRRPRRVFLIPAAGWRYVLLFLEAIGRRLIGAIVIARDWGLRAVAVITMLTSERWLPKARAISNIDRHAGRTASLPIGRWLVAFATIRGRFIALVIVTHDRWLHAVPICRSRGLIRGHQPEALMQMARQGPRDAIIRHMVGNAVEIDNA